MDVFHIFLIIQIVPNRAKHHIEDMETMNLKLWYKCFPPKILFNHFIYLDINIFLQSHCSKLLVNPFKKQYRNQSIHVRCKSIEWFLYDGSNGLNPFQTDVAFHIETSHLICNYWCLCEMQHWIELDQMVKQQQQN